MTLKDPQEFLHELDALEAVEKASMRMVSFAMHNILELAGVEFAAVVSAGPQSSNVPQAAISDKANYLCEDLTRMALDQIGASRVPDGRLFGAIDYKAACLHFSSEFAVEQALFVDSKAEKDAANNCRIQTTQTSLEIRQMHNAGPVTVQGLVDKVWTVGFHRYLTTTMFVKYHYSASYGLKQVTIAALPHGFLQDRYNPTHTDDLWNVGPNSPIRQEAFRTRLNFTKLEMKASWRVQRLIPGVPWSFVE